MIPAAICENPDCNHIARLADFLQEGLTYFRAKTLGEPVPSGVLRCPRCLGVEISEGEISPKE
jgi:hypothetical protein